jgi:hypothetical protein
MSEIVRVNSDRPWLKKVFEGLVTGTPFGWIASDRALKLKYHADTSRQLGNIGDSLRQLAIHSAESEGKQERIAGFIGQSALYIAQSIQQCMHHSARSQQEGLFTISNAIAEVGCSIIKAGKDIAEALDRIAQIQKYQGTPSHEIILEEIEALNRAELQSAKSLSDVKDGLVVSTFIRESPAQMADLEFAIHKAQQHNFATAIDQQRGLMWKLVNSRTESGDAPTDGRDIAIKKAFLTLSAYQSALRVQSADPHVDGHIRKILITHINQMRQFIGSHTGVEMINTPMDSLQLSGIQNEKEISGTLRNSQRVQELLSDRLNGDSDRMEVSINIILQGPKHPLYQEAMRSMDRYRQYHVRDFHKFFIGIPSGVFLQIFEHTDDTKDGLRNAIFCDEASEPYSSAAYAKLALAFAENGNIAKAQQMLERAKKIDRLCMTYDKNLTRWKKDALRRVQETISDRGNGT